MSVLIRSKSKNPASRKKFVYFSKPIPLSHLPTISLGEFDIPYYVSTRYKTKEDIPEAQELSFACWYKRSYSVK
jgi:ABC-type uncharacterized transport system substrate-binding protein